MPVEPTLIDINGLNTNLEVILPELIVTVLAVIIIFVDLFTRGRADKNKILAGVSIAGYVLAFAACLLYFNNNARDLIGSTAFGTEAFNRMVTMDNLGLFFRMLSLGAAIVTVLLSMQYIRDRGLAIGEY